MAFRALLKNQLHFSEHEMKCCSTDFLQLFFLSREPSASKIKPSPWYAFTRKTFQEYFSAYYLGNQVLTDKTKGEALLSRLSPVGNCQVWKFLFQLVAKKSGEIAIFLVSCLGAYMSNHPIHEANNDTALTNDEVQFEADEEEVMWSFRSSMGENCDQCT